MSTSISSVCDMIGILPATLENWQTASLITPPCAKGYSEPQVAQIRVIRALTSSGDTLEEIHTLLNDSWHYRASGWGARREEFLFHLRFGTDETRAHYLWERCTHCSPEHVRVFLLIPMASWLWEEGRETLRTRFIKCLLNHTARLMKSRQGEQYVKPLMDIIKMMKPQPSSFSCMNPQANHWVKTGFRSDQRVMTAQTVFKSGTALK